MTRRHDQPKISPLTLSLPLLGFIAGVVDVVCFFGLFHVFAAFITGTLIIFLGEVAQFEGHYSLRFVIIATFVIGAIGWSLLVDFYSGRRLLLTSMLTVEGVLLLAFAVLGTAAAPLVSGADLASIVLGIIAAVAMSLQNVLMATSLSGQMPTTVMTGNTIHTLRSANVIFRSWFGKEAPADVAEARTRLRRRLSALASFAIGVVFGGVGLKFVGFAVVAVPAVLLLGAAFMHARQALDGAPGDGAEPGAPT